METHIPTAGRVSSSFSTTSKGPRLGNRSPLNKRARQLQRTSGFSPTHFRLPKHETGDTRPAQPFFRTLQSPRASSVGPLKLESSRPAPGTRPVPDIAFPPLDAIIEPLENPHRKPYFRHPVSQQYSPEPGEVTFRYPPARRTVKSQPVDDYALHAPATPTPVRDGHTAAPVLWGQDSPVLAVQADNRTGRWAMNYHIDQPDTSSVLHLSLPAEHEIPTGSRENIYARQLRRDGLERLQNSEQVVDVYEPFLSRPFTPTHDSPDPYDIPLSPGSLAALSALSDHVPDTFTHNGVLFRNSPAEDAPKDGSRLSDGRKRSRDTMEMPYFYPSPPEDKQKRA
ncbi:hypothetical protein HDU86_003083 [Geranomyces michiganensis]|nr:hypothetical protein HDU86_003083 [Geranomyces michiganensis]